MSRVFHGVSRIDIYVIYMIDGRFYIYEYVYMDSETPYHYYPINGSYTRIRFSKAKLGEKIATIFRPKIRKIFIPDSYSELRDE